MECGGLSTRLETKGPGKWPATNPDLSGICRSPAGWYRGRCHTSEARPSLPLSVTCDMANREAAVLGGVATGRGGERCQETALSGAQRNRTARDYCFTV